VTANDDEQQPAASSKQRRSVVIVGGGIAGLYAAYLLGRLGQEVQLFEVSTHHWGGRIDSHRYELDGEHDFIAEFGPMRFEIDLQQRLRRLCFHLGIDFESFSPTTAPIGTTHYDLTKTEKSFASVAELLEWAVLRMFFANHVKEDLEALDQDQDDIGLRELAILKRYMDKKYFCEVTDGAGMTEIKALPDETINANLAQLRAEATLRGEGEVRLERLGLWNALSEVVTPGALARIRDSGTFYHFIAYNPSALEWGIFWLRQASVMGGLAHFTRKSAPGGTESLATKLVAQIRCLCPTVTLSLGHEVVSVEHGKHPGEVTVRVMCCSGADGSYSFDQPADHVILALPRQPLLGLAEHFPADVRARLEGVAPLPLLKAFLVTRQPWWRHHLKAQTYAWLVPTRELHFFRPAESECPRLREPPGEICTCEQLHESVSKMGMIMLYTDQPAISYWQALMEPEHRRGTMWRPYKDSGEPVNEVEANGDGLLASLIRRLVMIPDPGLARKIKDQETNVVKALEEEDEGLAKRIAEAKSRTLGLAERIWSATEDEANQRKVTRALGNAGIDVDPGWREWLELAIRYTEFESDPAERIKECAKQILAYGIRDWSAPPFGGAAHVWLPGERADKAASSATAGCPLIAFSLRGRAAGGYAQNVHVCGEAYSGFQGFIEGALRTAEEVVETIIHGDRVRQLFSDDEELQEKEDAWTPKQTKRLTKSWKDLASHPG
jgi:hypothetical protein